MVWNSDMSQDSWSGGQELSLACGWGRQGPGIWSRGIVSYPAVVMVSQGTV